MIVCRYCLMAIEPHEGKQKSEQHYANEDDGLVCDWCNETIEDEYYEIGKDD